MFVSTSIKETTASINLLVYNDETSRVISMALLGRVARLASLLRESVVSLMVNPRKRREG